MIHLNNIHLLFTIEPDFKFLQISFDIFCDGDRTHLHMIQGVEVTPKDEETLFEVSNSFLHFLFLTMRQCLKL